MRQQNVHEKRDRKMIRFAATLICIICNVSYAQPKSLNTPAWQEILSSEQSWYVWGREFQNINNTYLPNQIFSQQTPIFAEAPSLILSSDNSSKLPSQKPSLVVTEHTNKTLSNRKTLQQDDLTLELKTQLEYDGFLKFDLTLTPSKPVNIFELAINLPIHSDIATKYSRYINYDYNTQRVDMQDLENSSGFITNSINLPFNPAVWIGNDQVGIEWISETNLNWQLHKPNRAISITPQAEFTTLKVSFIEDPNGYTLKSKMSFSFALFVTPSRPSTPIRYQMTSRKPSTDTTDSCPQTMLQFFNWTTLPVKYPGLPEVQRGAESDYQSLVQETQSFGRKFIPYGSIYILPSTEPNVATNADKWGAAPPRKNTHWGEKLNTKTPILPVTLDSVSLQEFLIQLHVNHKQTFNTGGIYFDGAAPYENAAIKTLGRSVNDRGDPLQYVPMFSHRQFVKAYWEKMKDIDPNYLILHHAPRVPKFATAFIDIIVVGEELNRIFRTQKINVVQTGIHPNGLTQLEFNKPEHYIPDYSTLPDSVVIGMRHHQDGAQYMLLPQVRKFNTNYLNSHPKLFEKWSESALIFAAKNDFLLWSARLAPENMRSLQCRG